MEAIIIGIPCGFSSSLIALSWLNNGVPDHFRWKKRSRQETCRRAYQSAYFDKK